MKEIIPTTVGKPNAIVPKKKKFLRKNRNMEAEKTYKILIETQKNVLTITEISGLLTWEKGKMILVTTNARINYYFSITYG